MARTCPQYSNAGDQLALNVAAQAVIKNSGGRVVRISVTTAGSTAGAANDCATTGAVAAANLIAAIPNAVGVIFLDWPFQNGLVITPGTGQVVSVNFD